MFRATLVSLTSSYLALAIMAFDKPNDPLVDQKTLSADARVQATQVGGEGAPPSGLVWQPSGQGRSRLGATYRVAPETPEEGVVCASASATKLRTATVKLAAHPQKNNVERNLIVVQSSIRHTPTGDQPDTFPAVSAAKT